MPALDKLTFRCYDMGNWLRWLKHYVDIVETAGSSPALLTY